MTDADCEGGINEVNPPCSECGVLRANCSNFQLNVGKEPCSMNWPCCWFYRQGNVGQFVEPDWRKEVNICRSRAYWPSLDQGKHCHQGLGISMVIQDCPLLI